MKKIKIISTLLLVLIVGMGNSYCQLTIMDGLKHQDVMTLAYPADDIYPEGYMVVSTGYNSSGNYNPVVTRVDMTGNILWEKKIIHNDMNYDVRALTCNLYYGETYGNGQVEGIILGGFIEIAGKRHPYIESVLGTGADGQDNMTVDQNGKEGSIHYVMQSKNPARNGTLSRCNIIAVGVLTDDFTNHGSPKSGVIMGYSGNLLNLHFKKAYNSPISPTATNGDDFDSFMHVIEVVNPNEPNESNLFVTGSKNALKYEANSTPVNKQITLSLMFKEDLSGPLSTLSLVWDKSFANSATTSSYQHSDLGIKSIIIETSSSPANRIVILGKESFTHCLSMTEIDLAGNIINFKNFKYAGITSSSFAGFDLKEDNTGGILNGYIVSGYVQDPPVGIILEQAIIKLDVAFNFISGVRLPLYSMGIDRGISFYRRTKGAIAFYDDEWPEWHYNNNGALTNLEEGIILGGYRGNSLLGTEDRQIYVVRKSTLSNPCNTASFSLTFEPKVRVSYPVSTTEDLSFENEWTGQLVNASVQTTTDKCAPQMPSLRSSFAATPVENEIGLKEIKVFPSPASSKITIDGLNDGLSHVFVIDISGKVLIQKEILFREKYNLNIENLEIGLYVLKIEQQGVESTLRFVKE